MVRLIGVVLVIWLVVGAVCAGQRNYYHGSAEHCAHDGTVIATILAGPLNYAGANPKVHCSVKVHNA